MATKMGTIVGDLYLMRRSKAFHWRQNRFETLQHIEKRWGGFYQPPLPLYHHGVWICVCVKCRLGYWNVGYITNYKFIPLKASCWNSIAFLQDAWLHSTCSFNRTACSAPVFIKYFYKNYFQHATLLKPSQHHLSHVMMICILFVLKLSICSSEKWNTL